jgi:MFS family permease
MVFLGWAIGSPTWGWFSDYLQLRRQPIIYASVVSLVLMGLLFYVNDLSLIAIYLILLCLGLSTSVQILVFSICREVSHIRITGTAVSLTNAFVMLGGSLLQPIIGKLLDLQWTGEMVDGARVYSTAAYQLALSVMPVSVILTLIIMLFVRETHCKVNTNF